VKRFANNTTITEATLALMSLGMIGLATYLGYQAFNETKKRIDTCKEKLDNR
jgi:hypothetical protein